MKQLRILCLLLITPLISRSQDLNVNGNLLLQNSTGLKSIKTWHIDDDNWRIGMNTQPGFNRSLTDGHVQYITFWDAAGQGFAIGKNTGYSSFELRGADHQAYFRGNVGIGTINTFAALTVNGGLGIGTASIPMGLTTELGGYEPLLNFGVNFRSSTKNTNYLGSAFRIDTRNNNPMLFQWLVRPANTTEEEVLMVLSDDGKLGIGNKEPGLDLDIKRSSIEAVGVHVENQDAAGRSFVLTGEGNLGRYIYMGYFNSGYSDPNSAGRGVILSGAPNGMHLLSGEYMSFNSGGYDDSFERMRITKDGKIGVNTASPAAILDVHSSGPNTNVFLVQDNDDNLLLQLYEDPSGHARLSLKDGTNDYKIQLHAHGDSYFNGGNIGIGTTTPCTDCKLDVNGKIRSEEVVVEVLPGTGPDYVFEDDYNLKPLREVKQFIDEHKHLPEIPKAVEMESEGLNLRDMNLKLLQKIEELTLHLIDQNSRIEQLESQNNILQEEISKVKSAR